MKYHNIPTVIDGVRFSSKKEAGRYSELKLLEKGGVIKNLSLQPRFLLLEAFIDGMGVKHRKIEYVADFAYFDVENNTDVVEDVKGMRNNIYKLKLKFFLAKYPQYRFIET